MRLAFSLTAAVALALAAPAAAAPADDFHHLLDDHYRWLLSENPTDATALGVHHYDERIRDLSPVARERRTAAGRAFLARLEAIPAARLTGQDRVNRAILRRLLAEDIEAEGFGQRDMLFTTYAGWHQSFAGLARSLSFRTRADFDSYLTRISQYPRLNDQALALTANAVRGGFTLPCSVLANHERSIAGVIASRPDPVALLRAFCGPAAGVDRPDGLGDAAGAGARDHHDRDQPGLSEASRFLHAGL